MGGKKNRQIQTRISKRRLALNLTLQQAVISLHTKYKHSSLQGCREILAKLSLFKECKERKLDKYKRRYAGDDWFSIPRYNNSSYQILNTCVPNMTILACTVVEESLTKKYIVQSMKGKKTGQTHRGISGRRLVLSPTIQVLINLYTNYDHFSLHDD